MSLFLPSQPGGTEKAVVYEILVNGEEKEVTNVRKDLESGYDEVVLCVDHWETVESLKKRIGKDLGDEVANEVRFQLLSRFLD